MSDNGRGSEDIAGLFRKFGGDVKGYREFATEPQMHEPAPAWRLVSGARAGAATTPPAPVATVPAPAPIPIPSAPAVAAPVAAAAPLKSLFVRPAPATAAASPAPAVALQPVVPAITAPAQTPKPSPLTGLADGEMPLPSTHFIPAPAPAVRQLDILFARLDGEPPPPAPESSGSGLLSRWRRPS